MSLQRPSPIDLQALAGFVLIVAGVALLSIQAALIVAGVLLVADVAAPRPRRPSR